MSSERIALVSERFPPDMGGLSASVGRLARGLAGRGASVHVFRLSPGLPPGTTRSDECDGLTVHHLGPHKRVEDTLGAWLAHVEAEHRVAPFSLLHAYYVTRAGFIAVHAAALLGVPSVVSARGNDLDRTVLDPSKAAHTLHALREARAVTANTHDLARKASALGGGREVTVIPNGVDTERFQPGERDRRLARELGLAEGPVVGFVGEARAKKGLAHLLVAFERLTEVVPATLLLVGGVREDDRPLVDVFRARHPERRVVEVDSVDPSDLARYYRLLDLHLMPSLRDGLPNGLLESMACGVPVVGTRAGGIPEVVRDGENGWLVDIGDVDGLVAATRRALADRDARDRVARAARETVLRVYTPERELSLTLEVYRQLGVSAAVAGGEAGTPSASA